MEFIKKSIAKIWEGLLQHMGVLIFAFLVSGSYLVAISKLKEFQSLIRSIPSDYFLTPLVLLLILFAVLLRINRTQERHLSKLKQEPEKNKGDAQFVTHLGVWWKIYRNSEYIEDFPYCACCDPKLKLVQTEWSPNEVFKCSKTNTEYKLYDAVPKRKEQVLDGLYRTYFRGFSNQFHQSYSAESRKIRALNPDMSEAKITKKLFEMKPLSFLPPEEQKTIINNYPNPSSALGFVEQHYIAYRKYFNQEIDDKK